MAVIRNEAKISKGEAIGRRFCRRSISLYSFALVVFLSTLVHPTVAAAEIDPGDEPEPVLDLDGLVVAAFAVDHRPVRHAFGFRLEAGGTRLVISGDTRRCPAVIAAARGADLLLHEVFVHRAMAAGERLRTAEGVANVAGYHTLSSEVGKIAAEAGAGALMLTHFVPPACDRDALLAEVAADFAGPVILGEDLMSYDLATRTLVYKGARLSFGG